MHYRLTDRSRQKIARKLYGSLEEEVIEIVEECLGDETDDEVDDSEDSEEEELEGGLADDEDPEKYDLDQLLKGIEVEFEHTDNPEQALEIAMDHLEEQDDYYDDLEEMEKEGSMRLKGISNQGMKRLALQILQNSASVDREAIQQLAYEALKADIHNGLQG